MKQTVNTLEIIRGDDKTFQLTFTDPNNDPIDITGWVIKFTVRDIVPATDVDSDTGAIIAIVVSSHTDPTEGKTQIPITKVQSDIEPQDYYYDIQGLDTSNKRTTFVVGTFRVGYDITRT